MSTFGGNTPSPATEPVEAPVRTLAVLTARAGREDDVLDLLKRMVPPSRAEPGNLRYDLWRDAGQSGRFVLDEAYRDAGALASHRASRHFQAYRERIGELADRVLVVLAAEDVR
jgi:quinol monooxygenase YgiN